MDDAERATSTLRHVRAVEVLKALRGRSVNALTIAEEIDCQTEKVYPWLTEFEANGVAVCTGEVSKPGHRGRPTKTFTLHDDWLGNARLTAALRRLAQAARTLALAARRPGEQPVALIEATEEAVEAALQELRRAAAPLTTRQERHPQP